MPFDEMDRDLAKFSRSRRRLYSEDRTDATRELLYGIDAINCGTDIRHFQRFLEDSGSQHPLYKKVHNKYMEQAKKVPTEDATSFEYEFIFHLVEDYEEIPTEYGDVKKIEYVVETKIPKNPVINISIPPVIGCSFHPVGFFKPKKA